MNNIVLTLAYEGTDFFGWQKTSTGLSIEESLEQVLKIILRHPVILQAASRTDRGVHAEGQVVNFLTDLELDFFKFQHSLNGLLPKSIRILGVEKRALCFHPTLDVKGKEYLYTICTEPFQLPHNRFFSWHLPVNLDLELMEKAAALLVGEHDFSAFCNQRAQLNYPHKRRDLWWIKIASLERGQLQIAVAADHFLYKMARNLVGTVVDVARGRLAIERIPSLLEAGARPEAGICAPAHGLSLNKIFY